MEGEPTVTFSNAACLDFSVARKGYLTAYRWSGERELSFEHLVYVPCRNHRDTYRIPYPTSSFMHSP
jgi:hypothetical protein